MDAKTPDPAVMGHLKFDPETHYEIGDGHVITYIGGAPFEIKSISSATDYVACRGDEYGYANYEVEAEGH
jgi:hypothetical protein